MSFADDIAKLQRDLREAQLRADLAYAVAAHALQSAGGGAAGVTSVALTMPTGFSVAGSPVVGAGTLAVTGRGQVAQVWYDIAARAQSNGAVTTAVENETHGLRFQATQLLTLTGIKFYYPGGLGAKTVKTALWNHAGIQLATASVAVNAANLYTATFASPYTLVAADINVDITISCYITDGVNAIRCAAAGSLDPWFNKQVAFYLGPNILMGTTTNGTVTEDAVYWGAGDTFPNAVAGGERYAFMVPVVNDF